MRNFAGKVAFITGGGSGIGLGMARAFLDEGMKVVIADRNRDHLAAAKGLLAGNNAVHFIELDVTDRLAFTRAAVDALAAFGKIHVLCNNAGVGGGGEVDDPDYDEWDKAVAVNLGGVVNGIKSIVPVIKAQGEGGHVVNTSSMAGLVPLPGMGAYSATKFAVRGLSESLRLRLAPEGIGVSCLYPGAVKTALVPVPEDDGQAPVGESGELLRGLWAAMRVAVEPIEIGRAVVEAVRANRLHILTHGEFHDEVADRHRTIEAGFPVGTDVPAARREFEELRRATVDRLFSMDAKD